MPAVARAASPYDRRRLSHRRRAGAFDVRKSAPRAPLPRRFPAYGQLRLAPVVVIRRHRGRRELDRLLLAHYLGLATLGPYGVVADVLRQSFTVLGEAIILSLMTVAKNAIRCAATRKPPIKPCRWRSMPVYAAASFGAAFFIVFGHVVLQAIILQPRIHRPDPRPYSDPGHRVCLRHHAQFLLLARMILLHRCQLSRSRRRAAISRGFDGALGRASPDRRPARVQPLPDRGLA